MAMAMTAAAASKGRCARGGVGAEVLARAWGSWRGSWEGEDFGGWVFRGE